MKIFLLTLALFSAPVFAQEKYDGPAVLEVVSISSNGVDGGMVVSFEDFITMDACKKGMEKIREMEEKVRARSRRPGFEMSCVPKQ